MTFFSVHQSFYLNSHYQALLKRKAHFWVLLSNHHKPHLFLCHVLYHIHQKTTTSSQNQEMIQYWQLKKSRGGLSLMTHTNSHILNLDLSGLTVCQACKALLLLHSQTNKVPLRLYTGLAHYKQTALSCDLSVNRKRQHLLRILLKCFDCVGPIHLKLLLLLLLFHLFIKTNLCPLWWQIIF